MWPFKKKKKKVPENTKFKLEEMVSFHYRDEVCFGFVYDIKEEEGVIRYDIQVPGQCPWFAYGIKEEELRHYDPPKFN